VSLHNYYKLLRISENASQKEIQTAYRKIALKYHPDKQPDEKGADEYFKIVTEGYNVLSNPRKKRGYDILIKNIEENKFKSRYDKTYERGDNRHPENIKSKLERIKKFKERESIELFNKRERKLSHKYRYPIIVLLIMSGYLYVFNKWFVNEVSADYLFIISGFFIYIVSTYYITNHLYIHLKAMNLIGKFLQYPFEKTSLILFLILVIGGPISITILNSIKKQYHLTNHSILILPDRVNVVYDKAFFTFKIGEEIIYKSTTDYTREELGYKLKRQKPVVRISVYNPKICRLEFVDSNSPEYLKL